MKTLALHWCVYLFFVFLGPREKRRVLSLSLHLTWMDTRLGSNTESMCFLLQMDTTEDLFFLLFLLSYTVDCAVHRTVGFFFFFLNSQLNIWSCALTTTGLVLWKYRTDMSFKYTGFVWLYVSCECEVLLSDRYSEGSELWWRPGIFVMPQCSERQILDIFSTSPMLLLLLFFTYYTYSL